jgi:acetoin utilization protein AcuB
MLVGTYMTRRPVTITPRDMLSDARDKMSAVGCRHLPVVEGDILVGIVSDRDLGPHTGHLDATRATAAMTGNPVTVKAGMPLGVAARLMLDYRIDSLPVVDDMKLIGIITASDILKAFVESRADLSTPA